MLATVQERQIGQGREKKEGRQRNVATAQRGVAGRVAAVARVGFSLEQRSPGDGESSGGCSILVKPLTFNSHLSFNMFHVCVPVALQGPGLIRSGLRLGVHSTARWVNPTAGSKPFPIHHTRSVFLFSSDSRGAPLGTASVA